MSVNSCQTSVEDIDVKSMAKMSLNRCQVMNDDVLGLILHELPVKQRIHLETVSHQFMDCVSVSLKSMKTLSVKMCPNESVANGRHNDDISDAIVHKSHDLNDNYCLDLISSQSQLDSLLQKLPNINALHLDKTCVDYKILQLIVNRCPQLKYLHLNDIQLVEEIDQQIPDQLSKLIVKSLVFNALKAEDTDKVLQTIKCLPPIESINVFNSDLPMDQICKCLSPTLRRFIFVGELIQRKETIEALIAKCPQLVNLFIIDSNVNHWDNEFPILCDHFKLKAFAFRSRRCLSTSVLNVSIDKLKHMKTLKILHQIVCDPIIFSSMSSLTSLSLEEAVIWPNVWSNLGEKLPSLRRLSLLIIQLHCECDEDNEVNECSHCIHDCMQSLSKLPKLKTLTIKCKDTFIPIRARDLNLFVDLSSLSLMRYLNVDSMVMYCLKCINTRVSKRYLKISLETKTKDAVISQLADNGVQIPKFMVFKDIKI